MGVSRIPMFIIKHLKGEDFAKSICDWYIFFPIDLSLNAGCGFESWMSCNSFYRLKPFGFDVFIKIWVGTDIWIPLRKNELLHSADIRTSDRKFLFDEIIMFIQFAWFISVSSFAFISVIILFDSSAIQIIKPCKFWKVWFYITQFENFELSL